MEGTSAAQDFEQPLPTSGEEFLNGEPLVANVHTRASAKSDVDEVFAHGEQAVPSSEESKEVLQEGDLVGTVHSRHSRTSVSTKGRTKSGASVVSTPSKERNRSDFSRGTQDTYPDTPSTHAPDSPGAQRLSSGVPTNESRKKIFEIPQPIGHSVLCMSQYRNSPRHTFQPRRRERAGPEIPGPGTYTHEGKPVAAEPSAIVCSRPATKENKFPEPGPGTHEQKSWITDGKQYTFGVPRNHTIAKVPGPGQYDAQPIGSKGMNYSMGAKGTYVVHNQVPGPGQYDHTKHKPHVHNLGAEYSMVGNDQRAKDPRYEQRPGPDRYELPTHMGPGKKISHGMPRQDRQNPFHSTPGPGHYGGHYTTFHLS